MVRPDVVYILEGFTSRYLYTFDVHRSHGGDGALRLAILIMKRVEESGKSDIGL
jgi:hypothetical protein